MGPKLHTVVVIEEDDTARRFLEGAVTQPHENRLKLVGVHDNVEDGIRTVRRENPDLIFLNIDLPFFTGLEMLGNQAVSDTQIIYIVDERTMIDEALESNQRLYLTTPITVNEWQQCIDRVTSGIPMVNTAPVFNDHSALPPFTMDKIKLPTSQGIRFARPEEIVFCEAKQENTLITLVDEEILVPKSLKFFENQLDSRRFFRIHKSFLLNLEHIDSYSKAEGGSVRTSTHKTIYVGRSKKKEFARVMGL